MGSVRFTTPKLRQLGARVIWGSAGDVGTTQVIEHELRKRFGSDVDGDSINDLRHKLLDLVNPFQREALGRWLGSSDTNSLRSSFLFAGHTAGRAWIFQINLMGESTLHDPTTSRRSVQVKHLPTSLGRAWRITTCPTLTWIWPASFFTAPWRTSFGHRLTVLPFQSASDRSRTRACACWASRSVSGSTGTRTTSVSSRRKWYATSLPRRRGGFPRLNPKHHAGDDPADYRQRAPCSQSSDADTGRDAGGNRPMVDSASFCRRAAPRGCRRSPPLAP